jgi:hypothetical protein
LENKALPLWYKDGYPQFHVPEELDCLTQAEKMLIQLASPFIPLQHIKNGVLGIKGHTCVFPQDVKGFAKVLPNLPNETPFVKVMHCFTKEVGTEEERKKNIHGQ